MLTPVELYNLLSDETRLRCVMLLHEAELCVCELTETLACSQPKVSRHLSMLRNSGIVSDKRNGQWVYYSINPALPEWVKQIISSNYESLKKIEPCLSDLIKLRTLRRDNLCS